jgi:dihydrofolate reductase
MGKHTFKGLATSWDQIPVVTSIVFDHNLRKNLSSTSTQHTNDKPEHGKKQKQKGASLKKK